MEWSDPVPQLVVFGTDYTLWPFLINLHFFSPFTKNSTGEIVDSKGKEVQFYEDIPSIFAKLRKNGIKIGVVSRRGDLKGASQLITLFGWDEYLSFKEIYPEEIQVHFERMRSKSGIEYSDTLYFDDWDKHIKDAAEIGVCSKVVSMEMTFFFFEEGMQEYQEWKYNKLRMVANVIADYKNKTLGV